MKTQRGKILLVVLGMCCTLIFGMPVQASVGGYDDEISPQYVTLNRVTANLTISDGKAVCTGGIYLKSKKSCSIVLELQKKSGGSWRTIKTATENRTQSGLFKKSWSISKGASYRLKVTGKCGSDKEIQYSSTKSY